jgi:uncharacterized protein (UPF0335 family)
MSANNKVASYAERIERLLDERATIDADIKDIYQEVKSADLKPKVLRRAIANKRRKVDKQFEEDVEEYAALLLALPGATYRGVAEQTGIPKSTLQRRVPRKRNGTEPPHDPETGEISEIHRGAMQPEGCAEVMRTEPSMSGSVVASGDAVRDASAMPLDVAAALHSEGREHAGSAATAPPACSNSEEQGDRQSPLRGGTGTAVTSSPAPAAATISPGVPDDLQIPAHLDRRVRA